jgi:hypothetical protein
MQLAVKMGARKIGKRSRIDKEILPVLEKACLVRHAFQKPWVSE